MNKKFLITGMMLSCLIGTSFNAEVMGMLNNFRSGSGKVKKTSEIKDALLQVAPEKKYCDLPVTAIDNIELVGQWSGMESEFANVLRMVSNWHNGRGAVASILTEMTEGMRDFFDRMEDQSGMNAWEVLDEASFSNTYMQLCCAYAAMIGPENNYLTTGTTADAAKRKADPSVRTFLAKTPKYGKVMHPLQVEGLLNYTYKASLLEILKETGNLVYSGVPEVGKELPEDLITDTKHFDELLRILYNTKRLWSRKPNKVTVGKKYESGKTDEEVRCATMSIKAVKWLIATMHHGATRDAENITQAMNSLHSEI